MVSQALLDVLYGADNKTLLILKREFASDEEVSRHINYLLKKEAIEQELWKE